MTKELILYYRYSVECGCLLWELTDFVGAWNSYKIHVIFIILNIANCTRWKNFVVFMDWLATMKVFQWNNWYGHERLYHVAMEPWMFSRKLQLSSTTAELFPPQTICNIGYFHIHLHKKLINEAVMCLRGSRSSYHRHNLTDPSIDLACSESRLEPDHEWLFLWLICNVFSFIVVLLHKFIYNNIKKINEASMESFMIQMQEQQP